jgi:hypothetical protein
MQVPAVRTAAEAVLKAFVELLNPQGVKVVLPDFLAALDTKKNFQTKIAALQSLERLTERAPTQVQKCLPDIIPAVSAIMGDAKPVVKVGACSLHTPCCEKLFATAVLCCNAICCGSVSALARHFSRR